MQATLAVVSAVSAIALHKGDVAAACRALRNAGVDTHVLRTATVYCATLLRRVSRRANGEDFRHGAFSLARLWIAWSIRPKRQRCAKRFLVAAVVESGGDVPLSSSARQRACDALAAGLTSSDAVERGRAFAPAQMPLSDCHAEPSPRLFPDAREYIRRNEVTIGGGAVDPHLLRNSSMKTHWPCSCCFAGKEIARDLSCFALCGPMRRARARYEQLLFAMVLTSSGLLEFADDGRLPPTSAPSRKRHGRYALCEKRRGRDSMRFVALLFDEP